MREWWFVMFYDKPTERSSESQPRREPIVNRPQNKTKQETQTTLSLPLQYECTVQSALHI